VYHMCDWQQTHVYRVLHLWLTTDPRIPCLTCVTDNRPTYTVSHMCDWQQTHVYRISHVWLTTDPHIPCLTSVPDNRPTYTVSHMCDWQQTHVYRVSYVWLTTDPRIPCLTKKKLKFQFKIPGSVLHNKKWFAGVWKGNMFNTCPLNSNVFICF